MVNASKILTVSYGTFSCTLEGFDDPFSTMRSIAEYFRDLAADDRYFGAEPPTPDPEMLHRIAEAEIQRRVEAHVSDNEVVLRQIDPAEDTAPDPTPALSEEDDAPAATEMDVPSQEVEVASSPETATAVAATTAAVTAAVTGAPETVAEKLARIRAAVERSRNESEPLMNEMSAEAPGPVVAPESAAPSATRDTVSELYEATDEGFEEEADIAPEETVAEAEFEDEPDEVDVEPVEDALADLTSTDEDESPEEDDALANILADDAAFEEEENDDAWNVTSEEETDTDDSDADNDQAEEVDVLVNVLNSFEEDTDDTNEAVEQEAHPEETSEDSADSVIDQELAAILDAEPDQAFVDDTEEEAGDEPSGEIDLSAILGANDATGEVAEEDLEEQIDEEASFEPAENEPAPEEVAEVQESGDDAETETEGAPRVRVMKMKRDEFEQMFEPVPDEEPVDEALAPMGADAIRESLGETGLSEEDEADLVRELLDAQSDGEASDIVVEDASEQPAEAPLVLTSPLQMDEIEPSVETAASSEVAEALETLVSEADSITPDAARTVAPADDASVDRLLAETDNAMEEDDGNRRRSAIAHLKAAVAAVRADGNSQRETAEAETARTMDRFRDDLAQAVRPNAREEDVVAPAKAETPIESENSIKPASVNRQTDRPATNRPSRTMPPLMLVSEQRIDKDEEASPAAPVRPRRIQQSDDIDTADAAPTTSDFKAFIAKTGAEGLQEELEASLAFGIYVEGADFNSRPKIMGRVLRLYPDGSVTREDGLRAFGVLLREGRIQRMRRGEFLLPEDSRFHPDANPQANSA